MNRVVVICLLLFTSVFAETLGDLLGGFVKSVEQISQNSNQLDDKSQKRKLEKEESERFLALATQHPYLPNNKDLIAKGAVKIVEGFISKDSKYDIYYLTETLTAKRYVLSTNFKSFQQKKVIKAFKAKKSIVVFGKQDTVAVGQDKGSPLITENGDIVFKVDDLIGIESWGTDKGVFQESMCGDGCYISFIDSKGKRQDMFNGLPEDLFAFFENNQPTGMKVQVFWTGKGKDQSVVYMLPIK